MLLETRRFEFLVMMYEGYEDGHGRIRWKHVMPRVMLKKASLVVGIRHNIEDEHSLRSRAAARAAATATPPACTRKPGAPPS